MDNYFKRFLKIKEKEALIARLRLALYELALDMGFDEDMGEKLARGMLFYNGDTVQGRIKDRLSEMELRNINHFFDQINIIETDIRFLNMPPVPCLKHSTNY